MVNPPNTLGLLGKRVRYQGKEGLVVGRLDPLLSRKDRLAPFRGESVTGRGTVSGRCTSSRGRSTPG